MLTRVGYIKKLPQSKSYFSKKKLRFRKLKLLFRPRPPTPAATDADGNPAPVEAPRPGIFRMLWIFLSQFIASLIPQNPQAVNAN